MSLFTLQSDTITSEICAICGQILANGQLTVCLGIKEVAQLIQSVILEAMILKL